MLTRAYDKDDEFQSNLLEAVKEACPPCGEAEDDALWKAIFRALSGMSKALGYGCDLTSINRKEELTVRSYCSCCKDQHIIEPRFAPVEDGADVVLTLVKIQETTVTTYTQTVQYNELLDAYIFSYEDFEDADGDKLQKCGCHGCPPEWKLYAQYDAGYTELPDCLLDLVCKMVAYYFASVNKCDTGKCEDYSPAQWGKYLKSESYDDVKFTWDYIPSEADQIFNTFIGTIEMKELYQYSINLRGEVDIFVANLYDGSC